MPEYPFALIRELDHRTSDGLDVRLLWSEYDRRVAVVVHDATTGDGFSVPVLPHDRALDVFLHPFAYAAARGIPTRAEIELMLEAPPAG